MARAKDNNNPRLNWQRKYKEPKGSQELLIDEIYSVGGGVPDNLLVYGDNYSVMNVLKEDYASRIDLIYIDPPYATGRKISGSNGSTEDEKSFDDRWESLAEYLDMLSPRLEIMRELLAPTGSIYVHVDWHAAHYVKVLMDEIFGIEFFQNEIAWCYREAVNSRKRWNRKHDSILFYSKSDKFTFNYAEIMEPHSESTLKKYRHKDENGPYRLMGRGLKDSPIRSARDVSPEWEKKHPELTYRHYLKEGRLPVDYWIIDIVNQAAAERTGYPTQKPLPLLERIIRASSNPGDIVADFYCGSGVTAEAAAMLGRKWICCDGNIGAVNVTRKRILMNCKDTSFRVEKIKGAKANYKRTLSLELQKVSKKSIRISLDNEQGDGKLDIDYWAVDINYKNRPFSPCWWSCSHKKKKLITETPELEVQSGHENIAVMATDISGKQYFRKL